ncbi:MAG: type II secretion system protein [Dissulfurimicrobium sp.]|uniref:type II secretion system protein n=1 Tax=Dissulfurimicrobium sp. TaxID=2022436 RepID=UPI00404B89B8
MNSSNGSSGFTLIEVLVATAIVGIALGVILSSIAMGHRQAFRGDQAREAAEIADGILQELSDGDKSIVAGSGRVEGHPGWSYRLDVTDAAITVQNDDMGEKDIDTSGITEIILNIVPPGTKIPFIITSLVQSAEQKASNSPSGSGAHMPLSRGAP